MHAQTIDYVILQKSLRNMFAKEPLKDDWAKITETYDANATSPTPQQNLLSWPSKTIIPSIAKNRTYP